MVHFLLVWKRPRGREWKGRNRHPVDCFDICLAATAWQALPIVFYLLFCWQVPKSTAVAGVSQCGIQEVGKFLSRWQFF